MGNLIKYEGVILQRDGQLANSLECCCDERCDCCEVSDTTKITNGTFTYTGNFGLTGGTIVSYARNPSPCGNESIIANDAGNGYAIQCTGRMDFEVQLTNGACQEEELVSGYACLYILESKHNDNKGNCCYWEVWVEEPYSPCLLDGFPDFESEQPAVLHTCQGADAPSDCTFLLPTEPCYGFCRRNRAGNASPPWEAITFKTDAPGRCNCDTYYLDTSGGAGGGGSSPPGGGGSSPP